MNLLARKIALAWIVAASQCVLAMSTTLTEIGCAIQPKKPARQKRPQPPSWYQEAVEVRE